ncbi:MAG: DinB family protein [Bacteroidota bacterium]
MTKNDLLVTEYAPYYEAYIQKTEGLSAKSGLIENSERILSFLNSIPVEKQNFRYADGKWSIKEVIQHIIDTERVFSYRALCISRDDKTPMPNYDQDRYVENSQVEQRTIEELIKEYQSVRLSTISLFDSFDDKAMLRTGIAAGNNISVRAIIFILMGHEIHHCEILKARYL